MTLLDIGLLIALAGLLVAGLASIIGIWVERDTSRPTHWAISLSVLILLATVVSMYQSYSDSISSAKLEEDLARMLQSLDKLSSQPGCEGLDGFVSEELAAQNRSNPDVVKKLANRVEADGGDPSDVLGRRLPASELGSGVEVDPDKVAAAQKNANAGELEALETKVSTLQKELEKLRGESEKAKAAVESEKTKAAEADKKASEAEGKVEGLETEIEKLKADLAKAKKSGNKAQPTWNKG